MQTVGWVVAALVLASCGEKERPCATAELEPVDYPAARVVVEGEAIDPGALLGDAELVAASEPPSDLPAEAAAAWARSASSAERSLVDVRVVAGRVRYTYVGGNARALRLGELRARSELGTPLRRHVVVDWPGFAMRGVIEGFYGPPYTRAERRDTVLRMARLKMNTYLYGPKDDPYHRARWAERYPDEVADAIAEAARICDQQQIDFVWSVSPGYGSYMYEGAPEDSIEYGSAGDFERLTSKLDQLRALGVRRFALFLDDVRDELPHAADRARFPLLVAAQIDLVNRLQAHLAARDPGSRLLFVGTRYTGLMMGWQDYTRALGDGLRSDVDVMWTGPLIFSDVLDAANLAEVTGYLKRKPIIWDNWPPLKRAPEGRSADLPSAAGGILSNAVLSEGGVNPIGDFWSVLGPIADYAWNPETYVAAASYAKWQSLDVDLCR